MASKHLFGTKKHVKSMIVAFRNKVNHGMVIRRSTSLSETKRIYTLQTMTN
jgi:hypothetical protein